MNGFPAEVGAPLQLLMFLLAGGFGAGALIHLFAAREGERRVDHLLLVGICLISCGYLSFEAIGLHIADPAVLGASRKSQVMLTSCFIMILPWFVRRSTGAGPWWLPVAFAACGAVALVADLRSDVGLRLERVDSTEAVTLPWGEVIHLARGPVAASFHWWFALLACLSLYGMWCALRSRRSRAMIGWRPLFTAHAYFYLALIHDYLLDRKILHDIYLSGFSLPILAGAVWWRLSVEARRRIAFYRDLFQRSGDALFVHDQAGGELIDVNESANALLGRRPGSPTAPGPAEVALSRAVDQARAQGRPVAEHQFVRHDGTSFPAELSVRETDVDGERRVITSVRDLTERRRVERELVENELRLRTVIERSPIPIAEASLDGRVHAFNPRFTEAYGFSEGDAGTFDEWAKLMHPDPLQQERLASDLRTSVAQAALNGGVIPSLRMTFQDKRGKLHHADLCGVVVGSRMFIFLMELTDILQARDELARQEAFLRAAIDSATDGVCVYAFILGGAPRVALWNPRMTEITGVSRDQAMAGGWAPQAGDGDPRVPRERLDLITAGHPLRDVEWDLARGDGSVRSCTVSITTLPAPADERRILVTVRDITELRSSENERRVLDAKVEHAQKLESLGVLAGGIAHDFNNILMSILGRTDLIRLALGAGHPVQDHLGEVKDAARRASDLCQQMLAYAGKGKVQVGPVDLRRLVDDMSRMLEVSISKRIVMTSSYDAAVPSIQADASQLQQVVMNLITNASDAIDGKSGTITRRIGVTTRGPGHASDPGQDVAAGDYVFLEIADSGCGMDAYTRGRIFDPFFTTKFTGRGLGMAAVLGIMRAHRGAIEVESEPGRGTTIRVLFPVEADPAADATGAGLPGVREATPRSQPALAPRTGTVMVVDDEASIRALTADMLSFLGYDALQAASGTEAIAMYRAAERPIGAVILDLTMPDLNGDETLRELRRIDPDVRVVLASGYSRHEVARMLEASEVTAFLQKPFDVTALAQALQPRAG